MARRRSSLGTRIPIRCLLAFASGIPPRRKSPGVPFIPVHPIPKCRDKKNAPACENSCENAIHAGDNARKWSRSIIPSHCYSLSSARLNVYMDCVMEALASKPQQINEIEQQSYRRRHQYQKQNDNQNPLKLLFMAFVRRNKTAMRTNHVAAGLFAASCAQ